MHLMKGLASATAGLSLATTAFAQLNFDTNDPASLKSAAKTIATNMMSYYVGNQPGNAPGLLPDSGQPNGYGWWEGGEVFGALVDYYHFTGDSEWNDVTTQALQFQRGENNDYDPRNYSIYLGNDDISFWAMAAMTAAETKYPNPPSGDPGWLALVQAVWNEQAARWDPSTCGGGLRWQRFLTGVGYNYKNSITQGCFFQLGARLGLYTGNKTYLDWAEKAYDWTASVGLIDNKFNVWDGLHIENCDSVNHLPWTYNVGNFMYGAAIMWNATGNDAKWRPIVQGFLTATEYFFPNLSGQPIQNVMVEQACEPLGTCNVDQHSFKSDLSRWLVGTAQMAPWTVPQVDSYLLKCANAIKTSCLPSGQCGFKWTTGNYDGQPGIGQQLNALQTIQGLLYPYVSGPVTAATGGISEGDPNAGVGVGSNPAVPSYDPITGGDRAGAGILTTIIVLGTIAGAVWMAR